MNAVCLLAHLVLAAPIGTVPAAQECANATQRKARAAELNPTHAGLDDDALDGRLTTLCDWEARPSKHTPTDPELLNAILSQPEFAHARERPSQTWQRLWAWLVEQIDLFLQGRPMQSFASGTRTAVLVAAVAVVIFALSRLWRRFFSRRSRRLVQSPTRASEALVLQTPSIHLSLARELLDQSPRLSIREGLLALLSTLEQARWARPERVKTNREVARELADRGAPEPVSTEVHRLLGWYDDIFYSLTPVPGTEARRFLDDVDKLDRLRQQVAR
jgi:hypothetical protein